jgi:hypothetical protein
MTSQFIVQLPHRPGSLARLARALAARDVNIAHLAGGAGGEVGYAVLVTGDHDATRSVLAEAGYGFIEGKALVLELVDRPGELATVAERLGDAGIRIHGILVVDRRGRTTEVALSVDDPAAARRALGID